MKAVVLTFFSIFAFSCAHVPEERGAELVVTYDGREVHRSGSRYLSLEQFTKIISNKSSEKYIIFGADWCPSCKKLYKAMEQSGHLGKVAILNVEEAWVSRMAIAAGLKHLPAMLVVSGSNEYIALKIGASDIIMYLLINVET